MDEQLQRRLAGNEAVFREVNEGIQRGQWPGEDSEATRFRCECARLGCNLLIELSLREYEEVRRDPRQFMMVAGHELPGLEKVIARRDGYVIVAKLEEAGEQAEEADPRSDED